MRKGSRCQTDMVEKGEAGVNYPGWIKGIYPTREDASIGIAEHSLFVAQNGNEIVGTIILNHKPENGYESAKWQYNDDYSVVLVIHTLVVHPASVKLGIGAHG